MMPTYLQDLFKSQSYDANNFFLIAGPCVVESEDIVMEIGEKVSTLCKNLGIPYVFKASYRKANRTSANSFTGTFVYSQLACCIWSGCQIFFSMYSL